LQSHCGLNDFFHVPVARNTNNSIGSAFRYVLNIFIKDEVTINFEQGINNMLFQMYRTCKYAVNVFIEEITDAKLPFTKPKSAKPTTQPNSELPVSEEDELPDLKLD
jgi:hypothetical protein